MYNETGFEAPIHRKTARSACKDDRLRDVSGDQIGFCQMSAAYPKRDF